MLILRPSETSFWLGNGWANFRTDCFAETIKTVLIWDNTVSKVNSIRGRTNSNASLKGKGCPVEYRLFKSRIIATPICVMFSFLSNITWNGNALQNDKRFIPPRCFFAVLWWISRDNCTAFWPGRVFKSNVWRPSLEWLAFLQPVSLIENTTWPKSSERACCTVTSTSVFSISLATAFTIPITICSKPCLRE